MEGVSVQESGIEVEILHLHFDQLRLVAPVQRLYVSLNIAHHRVPVVRSRVVFPALLNHVVFSCLCKDTCIVHHLLGNAAHIDASST